jgi:hypothetical protein
MSLARERRARLRGRLAFRPSGERPVDRIERKLRRFQKFRHHVPEARNEDQFDQFGGRERLLQRGPS